MFQRRWYVIVAWGLMLSSIGFCVGFILLKTTDPRSLRKYEDEINAIGTSLIVALGMAAILWASWAVPFLASKRLVRRSNVALEQQLGFMRVGAVVPAALFLTIGTLVLYNAVFSVVTFRWNETVNTGIGLIVVGIVFALIGRLIKRKTIARLKQAFRDEKVCFKCAYDLRGSESMKCPECGHDNHQ